MNDRGRTPEALPQAKTQEGLSAAPEQTAGASSAVRTPMPSAMPPDPVALADFEPQPSRALPLTELETKVLSCVADHVAPVVDRYAAGTKFWDMDQGEWAMVIQDFSATQIPNKQLRGVLSSLVQKGYLEAMDVNQEYSAFFPVEPHWEEIRALGQPERKGPALVKMEELLLGKMADFLPANQMDAYREPIAWAMKIEDFGDEVTRGQVETCLSNLEQMGYVRSLNLPDGKAYLPSLEKQGRWDEIKALGHPEKALGLRFELTPENRKEVERALMRVPRPEGVKLDHTYQVGTVTIPTEFKHRTTYETAAWYTDVKIPPQESPINRRYKGNYQDSGPFAEPSGTIVEDYGATLFGGVQIPGGYDRFAKAGQESHPIVNLARLPEGSVVTVGGPAPNTGSPEITPAVLQATKDQFNAKCVDKAHTLIREAQYSIVRLRENPDTPAWIKDILNNPNGPVAQLDEADAHVGLVDLEPAIRPEDVR